MIIAQTAGEIRRLLEKLPYNTPITPTWANGPPSDSDPAVVVHGFVVEGDELRLLVDIRYLDDFEDDNNAAYFDTTENEPEQNGSADETLVVLTRLTDLTSELDRRVFAFGVKILGEDPDVVRGFGVPKEREKSGKEILDWFHMVTPIEMLEEFAISVRYADGTEYRETDL